MPSRSNLRIRSNVYWRNLDKPLAEDRSFTRLVRGRDAIAKLFGRLGIPAGHRSASSPFVQGLLRQGTITPAQVKTLEWHTPCSRCGTIPCGLTFDNRVEFRCEDAGCTSRATLGRVLAIPVSCVERLRDHNPSECLLRGIEACAGAPPSVEPDRGPKVRVSVVLDAAIAERYLDEELAAFLIHGLGAGEVNACPAR
jgi:hypothetical protein